MRYLKYILVLPLLISPALAEEKKTMNYFVASEKNAQPPKPSEMMQSLRRSKPVENKAAAASEKSADQAWETYKALAAGKGSIATKAPEKPSAPSVAKVVPQQPAAAQAKPAPATGVAGLIQEYRKAKESRSQMNTLVVNPRSAP